MKSIKDINFAGRKVLLRVDFNVPMNDQKQITDDTRMRESMPTIEKLLKDGAAIIIMAHFGRPKKGGFEPELTLEPVAKYLETLVKRPVKFTQELLGSGKPEQMAKELKSGEVMLLENIRFYPEETKGGEDLARQLAALGDCYINDAFGAAHREHSSTAVIARFFPNDKYFGFLMENEVRNLEKLMQNPPRPFTAIIGGSKVSSKIGILENLLDKVDNMIIIGGMRYTFTKALGGKIGNSICEDDKLDLARELMRRMDAKGVKYYLPVDSVIGDKFGNDANTKIVPSGEVPDGWESCDRRAFGARDLRQRHQGHRPERRRELQERLLRGRRWRRQRGCRQADAPRRPDELCLHRWRRHARIPRRQGPPRHQSHPGLIPNGEKPSKAGLQALPFFILKSLCRPPPMTWANHRSDIGETYYHP